ncbi:MAG: hypothetical protein KY455_13660 [Euryarchaeota archaeon]|nr:hypothetical protein [Euryarchaeota archaeon]
MSVTSEDRGRFRKVRVVDVDLGQATILKAGFYNPYREKNPFRFLNPFRKKDKS